MSIFQALHLDEQASPAEVKEAYRRAVFELKTGVDKFELDRKYDAYYRELQGDPPSPPPERVVRDVEAGVANPDAFLACKWRGDDNFQITPVNEAQVIKEINTQYYARQETFALLGLRK